MRTFDVLKLTVFLLLVLVLAAVGCTSTAPMTDADLTPDAFLPSVMRAATEAPTAEPTETPTAEPTETPTAEPTETPTGEPTQTPPAGLLPDLTVNYVSITLEDPSCYDGSSLGTQANIGNIGAGNAGLFVVDIDGTAVEVEGLAAGESTSVWVSGYANPPLVVVDATELIAESNEENNVFNELVPVPTLPRPCD